MEDGLQVHDLGNYLLLGHKVISFVIHNSD